MPTKPARLLIVEADDCDRSIRMLDLTGDKPFLSKPFGQPVKGYVGCLEMSGVDWRKSEAIIHFNGFSFKYKYKTGEATGPIS